MRVVVLQAELELLEWEPGERGLCPALSLTRPSGSLGVALNLGQEPFRYQPFYRTTAGGKLVIRAVTSSSTQDSKAGKAPPPSQQQQQAEGDGCPSSSSASASPA